MNDAYNNSLKSKIRQLNKGLIPDGPLFLPLIYSMGTQIEAISIDDFAYNPTKINKGLAELRNALDFGVVTPVFSLLMEAEALGAELDWSAYPPIIKEAPFSCITDVLHDDLVEKMLSSERVAAAIESTKRFKLTAGKDTLIVASLTGPATLGHQLFGEGLCDMGFDEKSVLLEFCGRCQAGFTRLLGEAGAQVIILHEPESENLIETHQEAWLSSLRPIINVARFHRSLVAVLPPLVKTETLKSILHEGISGAILCPSVEMLEIEDSIQVIGTSVSANPEQWKDTPPGIGLVVTRDETPSDFQIPELKAALERQVKA